MGINVGTIEASQAARTQPTTKQKIPEAVTCMGAVFFFLRLEDEPKPCLASTTIYIRSARP